MQQLGLHCVLIPGFVKSTGLDAHPIGTQEKHKWTENEWSELKGSKRPTQKHPLIYPTSRDPWANTIKIVPATVWSLNLAIAIRGTSRGQNG